MNPSFRLNEAALRRLAGAMRLDMLDMMLHAGANGAHIGGGFSAAEILACLYGGVMNVSPERTEDPERDRFILSKGHTALALYAALCETGFLTREEMMRFEDNGCHLATHCYRDLAKGIEISSGSLGLGLSYGAGAAVAAKRDGRGYDCFVLLGDGECNEGSVWEAAQAAARFQLDNLIAIVDVNRQSLDGFTEDVMPIHSFKTVFEGFGWDALEADGNDVASLQSAFASVSRNGKPTVILAQTAKGKGVSFMENIVGWHHASLTQEQYDAARRELEEAYGI